MCAWAYILGAFSVLCEFLFRYRFLIGFEPVLGRSWGGLGRSWGVLGGVLARFLAIVGSK